MKSDKNLLLEFVLSIGNRPVYTGSSHTIPSASQPITTSALSAQRDTRGVCTILRGSNEVSRHVIGINVSDASLNATTNDLNTYNKIN